MAAQCGTNADTSRYMAWPPAGCGNLFSELGPAAAVALPRLAGKSEVSLQGRDRECLDDLHRQ